MEKIKEILSFDLLNLGSYHLELYTLILILLVFLITKLILWLTKKALLKKSFFNKLEEGNAYALYQIIRYIIWIIALGFFLETIGVKITVLIAGSAALLVGIGLGLQQTFHDIISGLILLSERTVRLGDILEIDGDVIKIQEIGLRASKGLNRFDISIIIPNSHITNNKVINWSHQSKRTRFKVNVGVAYGSDIDLVLKTLEESVKEHPDITHKNMIEARFIEFNNSSLDFIVLFYSEKIFEIETIKSDLRRIINRKFIENNITIPFQQVDIHLKPTARGQSVLD